MAYQVDKFNGTFLVSVADGTIDNTTDLRFVGKNYAGYGEVQNENFLHLLENFANTTQPPKRIPGQIWYDSGNKKLRFFDGTQFKASAAEVGIDPPTNQSVGDFWFDTNTSQLKAWSGTEYILIGPAAAPEFGNSSAVGAVVQDTNGTPWSIVKLVSADTVVATISSNADFILNSTSAIPGFTKIKKGITLINTNDITGVTALSSAYNFWGTASNSLKLGGIDASNFLTIDNTNFTGVVNFSDSGLRLGDDRDLHIFVETRDSTEVDSLRDEDQLVISQTRRDEPLTFRVQVSDVVKANVMKLRSTGLYPAGTSQYYLGDSNNKWLAIHADSFNGNLNAINITATAINLSASNSYLKGNLRASDDSVAFEKSTKTFFGTLGSITSRSLVYGDLIGDVTGSATTASRLATYLPDTASTINTVAVRDGSGNITASAFLGTASQSNRLKIDNTASDTDPNYRSAKTTATPSSIAARDASGHLFADIFNGTATAARYADLAEKYLTDREYETGTVVTIGGDKEVTACTQGDRAIGVVSANPAFMMNQDLEGGTYIALKGRVPVKVTGPVVKGQRLVAGPEGTAQVRQNFNADVFAIALETNNENSMKLVEALVL